MSDSGSDPNKSEVPQNAEREDVASPELEESEELIGEILDLPPEKREKILEIFYRGPIPPPGMLRQFNDVVPGAAKQIMEDAHAEHLHRREMERIDLEHAHDMDRRQLKAAVWQSRAGQVIAFVLSFSAIGVGAWLIYNDKSGWGFALILLELAGLAAAFLYNDRRQRLEQQQAREAFPQEPSQ